MAHKKQIEFCISVKGTYPEYFTCKNVLDVGSMDINGNNRYLFTNCDYTGIDLGKGNNVDIVCPAHLFKGKYDVVISTNMLEHDKFYKDSLQAMVRLLTPSGMLIISARSKGGPEHGTAKHNPEASPFTLDYYKNMTKEIYYKNLDPEKNFSTWGMYEHKRGFDLYFWGIKKLSHE